MKRLSVALVIAFTASVAVSAAGATSGSRSALVIPIAGNTPGGFGTFWKTDLNVINHRDVDQPVLITYSTTGTFFYGSEIEVQLVLPARSTTTFEDVMVTLFHTTGLGVIHINPTFYDTYDAGADLDATYRIWTVQPGTRGTMSQSGSAIHVLELPPGNQTRIVIGAMQDSSFRCNVGVTNINYARRSFRITASSASGSVTTTLTVEGFNTSQVPLPAGNLGYMTVTIEPLDVDESEWWTAYATSVDNISGDGWLQNAESR